MQNRLVRPASRPDPPAPHWRMWVRLGAAWSACAQRAGACSAHGRMTQTATLPRRHDAPGHGAPAKTAQWVTQVRGPQPPGLSKMWGHCGCESESLTSVDGNLPTSESPSPASESAPRVALVRVGLRHATATRLGRQPDRDSNPPLARPATRLRPETRLILSQYAPTSWCAGLHASR